MQYNIPSPADSELAFESSLEDQVYMRSRTQGVHILFHFCLQYFSVAFLGGTQPGLQRLGPNPKG